MEKEATASTSHDESPRRTTSKPPQATSGAHHAEILDRIHKLVTSNGDTYKPSYAFKAGDWKGFALIVRTLAESPVEPPQQSEFIFEFSKKAADHNCKVLEQTNFDFDKHIKQQKLPTILSMGSEVRPPSQLDKLLSHHPNYKLFRWNTTHGIDYPISELPEKDRVEELTRQLDKGNHKSALTKEAKEHVDKAMLSDISLGYGIPLSIDCIRKLKHAEVYPVGLQHQRTINELGQIIPKKRMSHDLSNRKNEGKSINQRVIEENLPSVLYGYSLLRYLHLIHHIRRNHPSEIILCNKIDIEKAYRRFHTTPKIAAKCIAIWTTPENEEIGVLLTRLPFGSSPAPAHFSVGSDITCDISNDLLQCSLWDPTTHHAPIQRFVPQTKTFDKDLPFGEALEADVELESNRTAGVESYIDDLATAVLASKTNTQQVERAKAAVLMALHLQFRPHAAQQEPIERPETASERKLRAEGGMAEQIIYLGWLINTRAFTIGLPNDKAIAWSNAIRTILKSKSRISHPEMETLIGRINHVGFIIPQARHFINRIRKDERRAETHRSTYLSKETKEDLKLWINFIEYARKGISINSVIFRTPTSVSISDACETGMGGYDPISGKMWRHKFTEEEQVSFTLNAKEFLAAQISQELSLTDDDSPFPCHLNVGDSTVAEAWLYKSNHDPENSPVQNAIARRMANNLIQRKACNYSQHIKGETNVIADSLSRDTHLSTDEHTNLIQSTSHVLNPPNSKISPLSSQITSWIASLAQLQLKKRELRWEHTPSTLAAGESGKNSSKISHQKTHTSHPSPKISETQSYLFSWIQSKMENSTDRKKLSKAQLRERPQIMYRRSYNLVVGKTHDATQQERSAYNSNDN